jgi:D-amino-acid oxidase
MRQRVTVVGAGVIGLTCAVRLAEVGLEVDVLARDLPLETASAASGGLWLPASTDERELGWARASLDELRAVEGPASGVRTVQGHLLGRPSDAAAAPPPAWSARFADVVHLREETAPAVGHAVGWRGVLPVADPRRYLPWLRDRLVAAGGTLTRLALPALPLRGIVVNAAGVAARALASDPRVRPVRAQTALVSATELDRWWVDLGAGLSVLPYGDLAAVEGPGDDGDWNTAPDEAAARRLVERAGEIVAALRGAALIGVRVGLRPERPSVRLEAEHRPTDEDADRVVVHCYGHGSRGFTLSWGCADEVTRLVTGVLEPRAAFPAG